MPTTIQRVFEPLEGALAVPPSRPARWARQNAWAIGLFALAFLAYLPSLTHGFIWDDDYYVSHNIALRTFHGLRQIWFRPGATPQYYPITFSSFWLEYHAWGDHPAGYHVDNLLLHALNVILLALVLRRLEIPGALLAAAIFAVHPVGVETVAWVSERKNLLSTAFYLLAFVLALDVWQIAPRGLPTLRKRRWQYAGVVALFAAALLSKSVTASFPVAVGLLIVWKHRKLTTEQIEMLFPLLVMGLAMGAATSWVERHLVGAAGPAFAWTFPQRCVIAGRAFWFYLAKLAWPWPLMFIYPKWSVTPTAAHLALAVAAVGQVAVLALLPARFRGAFFAIAFFGITIFPALGFVNVFPMRYSFVADHFQYLASLGPIALIGCGLWLEGERASRLVRRGGACVLLGALLLINWQHQSAFDSARSLWEDVAAKNPGAAVAHANLGQILFDNGELASASAQFHKAIPSEATGYIGLALIAQKQGKPDEAMGIYARAIAADPTDPRPLYHRGELERQRQDWKAARDDFAAAASHLPNPAPALEQMGEIALSNGQTDTAIDDFHRALAADPDLAQAHDNLAAIALSGSDPRALDEAGQHCRDALAIDPDDPTACNNMGLLCVRAGHPDEALGWFRQALDIDPGFAPAQQNWNRITNQTQ